MRVPDVVWASPELMQRHGFESTLLAAPELCVEVLSPTNTPAKIGEKVAAYLVAGAREDSMGFVNLLLHDMRSALRSLLTIGLLSVALPAARAGRIAGVTST